MLNIGKKTSVFNVGGTGSGSRSEFPILLSRNQRHASPVGMTVNPDWDLPKFKKKASHLLGVKAKRVFLLGGEEVLASVDEISVNSTVYISQGEPYFASGGEDGGDGAPAAEVFRVAVLGTGGVGKSAVTLRFVRDVFVPEWESTIEDAYRVRMQHNGEDFIIDVLDTAGQDDFESLRPSWMQGKQAYIFVFSLAEPESYRELRAFFALHQEMNAKNRVQICIVGNKQDLVRKEDSAQLAEVRKEAKRQALEFGGTYFETSASSGENIRNVFQHFLVSRAGLLRVHNEMQQTDKCSVM